MHIRQGVNNCERTEIVYNNVQVIFCVVVCSHERVVLSTHGTNIDGGGESIEAVLIHIYINKLYSIHL